MKILLEKNQDVLSPSRKDVLPSFPNEFDLKLSNIKNSTLLEWKGEIIGRVLIKDDIFYLELNENAPKLVISDFPLQKQVLLKVENAVEVNCTKPATIDMLSINAGSIEYQTNTRALDIRLKARDALTISGSLVSEKIQFEASKFTNLNRIEGKETISINADNIELNGQFESNILLLKGGNLIAHHEAQIRTKESSVIIADSAELQGDLNLGTNLFCKANNLKIVGAIEKLSDAYLDVDNLYIAENGRLELDSISLNELKAKRIILDKGSKLKLNKTLISKAEILSYGEFELDDCRLEVNSLELQGHYSINKSNCVVKKESILQGDAQSILSNADFEAEKIDFLGNNNIQNVSFVTDNVNFSEYSLSEFKDSTFDVLHRVLLKDGAKAHLKNTAINSKYLQLLGESSLENCALESDIFATSAKTNLKCSKILVSDFWQNSGTKMDNCELKARSVDLKDNIYIQKSDFFAQTLSYNGSGTIEGSKFNILDYIYGSKESDLTFKHSFVETGQNYSQGILNFTEGSYYHSKYSQQSSGTNRINGSQVKNEELLFTFSGAQLISEAQSNLQVKSALFQGETNWNNSILSALGPVLFCGRTTGEKAGIASKGSIYLANGQHQFNQSTIFSQENISVTGDLHLETSKLEAKLFNVSSQNTQIENSQIGAENLKILRHFCAKKSLIKLSSALEAFCDSSISMEGSKASANSMKFWGKMDANLAEFEAIEDIEFKQTSLSNFQSSKLVADNISNAVNSKITGSSLETNSSHLSNYGSIGVDKFSASTTTLYNSGEIQSEQLQLKANLGLINTGCIDSENIKIQSTGFLNAFGSIKSTKSTTIQSPLLFNFCGDLASNGSLNMDSILHCNFGVERAFDLNNRSFFNFNYGLVLPNLPNSYEDFFTFSRWLSFTRMGLTQLLPSYSNVISLGSMAVPYLKNSAQYMYDFYNSAAPITALPSHIYTSIKNSCSEFTNGFTINEVSDIFPVMMNTMSTVLSGVQFGKGVIGAYNEINAALSDKAPEPFSKGVETSEEKTEPNPAAPESKGAEILEEKTEPNQVAPESKGAEILEEKTEPNQVAPESKDAKTSEEKTEPNQVTKEFFNFADAAGFLGEIAIKALGPSMNIQTIYGDNAGVIASGNFTESAIYDTNRGVRTAWNLVGDYSHGVNRGIFAGANVVATGKTYENFGNISNLKNASLLFSDSLKNDEGGILNLSNFYIKTGALDNAGGADLKTGKLEANTITSTGEAHFSGVLADVKETASLSGKYSLTNSSTLEAKNLNLENEGLIQQSTIKAQENLHQTGHLVSKEGTISGKNVSLSGTQATDGNINAGNTLTISHSETLGTSLAGENADLSYSTFRGKQQKKESSTSNSAASTTDNTKGSLADIEVKENLKTEEVRIENMQIEAGSHTDLGSTFKDAALKIKKDFSAKNSVFDETSTQAHNIYLSGETKAYSSYLQAENNLKQQGSCISKDTTYIGSDVEFDGLNAQDGKICAGNQLDINHSKTLGTEFSAKNANLKNSTFEGKKAEETSDKAAEMPSENQNSEPTSKQMRIEETLNTENVVMKDMQISAILHNDQGGNYERTHAFAKDAFLNGTKLTESFVNATHKLEIKNTKTLDCGFSAKKMELSDSTFKASQPKEDQKLQEIETKTELDNSQSNPTSCKEPRPNELGSNQINASKSINTHNVVFEGQSIETQKMVLERSKMRSTHAKVHGDFKARNTSLVKSQVEAKNASFKDKNDVSESLVKTKNTIVFEENSRLKTHNADFDAGKEILHRSKNHEQTGSLLFKAQHVESTTTSNLYSGEGENNRFYVQAETGNFSGKMHLDNGSFDVKHLNKVGDLIGETGQSAQQHFSQSLSVITEDAVNIENMKPRACNLAVRAKEIQVNTDYKSEHDLSFIATEGKVKINADVKGDKVVLQSEKSDIEVKGKTVEGKTYVYAEAAGNIEVRATEREFQGKYSKEKQYTKANIIGGTGNQDTGGAGVILKAGEKVIIDASNVGGVGKTVVSGDKGVELEARSHSYVSNRKSHNKRVLGVKHGKKKTETTEARIATSTLGSLNDQVQVISSEGEVTGIAGDFIAAKGTDVYAHGNIKLKSLITETKTRKQEKGCFGLNSKKKTEKHENVKLVDFVSGGNKTRLHSQTGNIYGTDIRFQGYGDLLFETPNGSTYLKSSKLNHSVKTKERKFSLSSPPVDSAKNIKDRKRFIQAAEPVLGQAEALSNAKTPLEKMAGASNLAIGAYNTASALAEGAYAQQLMQGIGFVPKINLNLTESKSESHYQTGTGAGIFQDGDVIFLARDNVELEGMPIIANNLGIRADQVRMSGQAFESSHAMETNSAQVGVSVTGGVTDASISHSSQKMKAKQYQNMQVQIKNKITIEAASLEMDAANMTCDTVAMKVDKLTIQTRQDELEQSSHSFNASTTGNVGMHQSHTESKQVNQTAGIHVRAGIEKGDMQVKEANLIGAAVTSDGYNGFEPDKLNTTTIKDSSHTRGFGISGNVNSISNAINSDSDSPSKLTTFSVSHEKKEYEAENRATIFGSAGVSEGLQLKNPGLNTVSANSKQVTCDKSQKITLDVPVEVVRSSVQSGIQFFKPVARKEDLRQTPFVQEVENSPIIVSNQTEEIILESDPDPIYEMVETVEANPVVGDSSSSPINIDNIGIEENQYVAIQPDQAESSQPGPFDPDLETQKLGMKQGRNRQQLTNKDNGQYTSLEKEIDISIGKNRVTTNIECVLIEEGDKGDGLYYNAKIDPLTSQLIIEGGAGKQFCFTLDTKNKDLGLFGSAAYAIDACSAQALIDAQLELSSTKAAFSANAGLGVMGPSATGSYSTPCISFMGVTFQIHAEGAVGVGFKGDVGLGAQADATKTKVGFFAKLGLFGGAGANSKLKLELGIDNNFSEKYSEACKNAVESDQIAKGIIEKYKQAQQEGCWPHLEEWERDHLDMVMDGVPCFFSN
jgi:hypothetical protein